MFNLSCFLCLCPSVFLFSALEFSLNPQVILMVDSLCSCSTVKSILLSSNKLTFNFQIVLMFDYT